jgi:16S rRNA pseudouridine516 synthase
MRLEQVLFSQGFGTRHECRGMILQSRVQIADVVHQDPDEDVDVESLVFTVDGKSWPYFEKAVVALHKPSGYECSQKPIHHPSVMTLLPAPLRVRGIQPVGRLDEDTTGLLILTDDGSLQHRLIHPKKHVAKVYEVTCRHPISELMVKKLLDGVMLDGEKKPVKADSIELKTEHVLCMTISQGKYHQVKRMIAAVSNRVDRLHRIGVGKFSLPEDLPVGEWRFINVSDLI